MSVFSDDEQGAASADLRRASPGRYYAQDARP